MGQREILEFLKKRWKKGDRKYYTVRELEKFTKSNCNAGCTKLRRHKKAGFTVKKSVSKFNVLYKCYAYRWKP